MPKIEKHQDGVAPQGCFVPEMALTVRPIEALKRFGPETRKHPEKQIKARLCQLKCTAAAKAVLGGADSPPEKPTKSVPLV